MTYHFDVFTLMQPLDLDFEIDSDVLLTEDNDDYITVDEAVHWSPEEKAKIAKERKENEECLSRMEWKGGGIQVELSLGVISVGLEVIFYYGPNMDESKYDYGFTHPYFYLYTGAAVSFGEAEIKLIFKALAKKLTGIKSLKHMLNASGSASLVGIWGDSTFKDPTSYEGRFDSASASLNYYKIGIAGSPDGSTLTASFGYGTTSWAISRGYTHYTLMNGKYFKEVAGEQIEGHLINLGIKASEMAKEEGEKQIGG